MSKTNYAIVELETDAFGDLREIAVITVDMATRGIMSIFATHVASDRDNRKRDDTVQELPLSDVLATLTTLLRGKKLAAHHGLDFEGEYLNNLLEKEYGFTDTISRKNIIDVNVLVMRYLKGINPEITSVARHLGVSVTDPSTALHRAYMTYGNLKNLFADSAIRQHSYRYSFAPIRIPEVLVEPEVQVVTETVEVEKIVYVKTSAFDSIKGLFSRKK